MHRRDCFDALWSAVAVMADAAAVYAGFMLAVWMRFDSGWIPLLHEQPASRGIYYIGAAVGTLLYLVVFKALGLYNRPQSGVFTEKIPRLVRASILGILLVFAMAFIFRREPPYSRVATVLSLFTVFFLLLIERWMLFFMEIYTACRETSVKRVLVIGVNAIAAKLRRALENEPRFRTTVTGFLRIGDEERHAEIPQLMVKGNVEQLGSFLELGLDEVIVTDSSLSHEKMVAIILQCERAMVFFKMVPDIFRMLTSVDILTIDGIPVLGIRKWPLDFFGNQITKKIEDVTGALIGLFLSAPIMLVAAWYIKRSSPGPVFYKQERCGEGGRRFHLYKLRTMLNDAEMQTGPVWAAPNDARRTPIGIILRQHNLDELPQFWNVLKGDMSLVGPRPERPYFVEQFKGDIERYMWRHVSKPGMTGWAQVNGLRGNSSIHDRITYDLYYLENWSLAFDFKILAKTFTSIENAY